MMFYKMCDCGDKIVFAQRNLAPRKCSNCGRNLIGNTVYEEEKAETDIKEEVEKEFEKESDEPEKLSEFYYSLEDLDGKFSISIPRTGGIVGRASIGAAELAQYSAISREHIKIQYRGHMGLVIEDISKFGTSINEERILKNTAHFIREGTVIKLYDVPLIVKKHDEEL